jgi:phosphate transport system substrate-binding protein
MNGIRRFRYRAAHALLAVALATSATVVAGATPASAGVAIDGAGSTWSEVALQQWRADVARQGLAVNYQGNGSTAGRVFYYSDQVDFAVSEIPFQSDYTDATGTVNTNEVALAGHRPWVYLPIVAGGTSFMYHLDIAGKRFTNLRLSPDAIAKIFTGVITRWNDPAIAADNPGVALPATAVRPVIRSDGSGTSAQFSAFLASQTPGVWGDFCRRSGITATPCPATSLYPEFTNSVGQQLSDGVADYVAAPYSDGTITYVEYAYALQRGFPVVSVLNAAGYYAQPTAQNVAIALQGARINPDRTQVLQGVYTFNDPRAYPVSSYSYMIAPASEAKPFSAAKGDVLGRFILYFLCTGQQKAAQLGYSPLPKNLVQVAFDAVTQIPGAPAPPPIDSCANPTITGQFITGQAPLPPAAAKKGATASGGGNGAGAGATGATGVASVTGASGTDGGTRTGEQLIATAKPVRLDKGDGGSMPLYVLAAVLVLLLAFAPPAVSLIARRRAERRGARSA